MFTARYVLHSTFCPHSVFMYFVWIWEQTAIITLYNINWLVFITETVYCAVRTECLYTIQVSLGLHRVQLRNVESIYETKAQSVVQTVRMPSEWRTAKDLEGSGRGMILGTAEDAELTLWPHLYEKVLFMSQKWQWFCACAFGNWR